MMEENFEGDIGRDHDDQWAKNKSMVRFPDTWFIFNL
jgi:hypothetical protein